MKNIFLRDHLRYLAIAKYRKRERRKMQGWGIKENFQPVLKACGTASGMPPLSSPQKFTQPFKLADPREAEWGWPRPLLANQEPSRIPPTQNKPAAPITAPPNPRPRLGVFKFLSHLPKPDFLFLRKKLLKYPLEKKKDSLRQLKHQRALRK